MRADSYRASHETGAGGVVAPIILPNVPTDVCRDDTQRPYVLEYLHELVVKSVNESGGYGMLLGPHASQTEREQFAAAIRANPRQYIAQPTLALSRAPIIVDEHLEGRHLDVKYFILLLALSDVGTPVDDAIDDPFFALHPIGDQAHTASDPLPRATQTQTVEPKARGA